MLCALLALLCALLSAQRVTCVISKCTDKACFTLHAETLSFENASANCNDNGGYLITVRNGNDLAGVKSLLAVAGKLSVPEKVWIGLKLSKGNCVLADQRLYGFRWTSGAPDSSYSNWMKEPASTCTEERCVSLSTSTNELKWSDGSCKERAPYVCVYYFKGMCKPLELAGPGEVNYTLPFLKVPLKQHGGLTMLPHATFADISCVYGSDLHPLAKCNERDGHFVWEKPGPFCAWGQRSCKKQNGGCGQLCYDDGDSGARCGCKKGYYLGDDKATCVLEDACHKSSCKHKCTSKPTGIECTCPEGFELSEDKVSCKDADECTQDICNGHICHNRQGGYECECKKGFKDIDGVCEDIDECLNRPCESICINTDGSYTCSCGPGFSLAENGVSCRAIIEGMSQPAVTTVTQSLSTETTAETHQSVRKNDSVVGSWVLVYALSSVIPLLLLITLTAVIVVHRWSRSRKDAKKKSATTDSYCWVSSEYTTHLETQRNRIY